ncbi:MAG: tRNA pseudouridine synthase A, partial [Deltaproteobacteria bacterium]|nr:tRNA pseudouridine synthase A [Deltaproteobacteria bacterium]
MRNYKIIIEYDGTHFSGWQTQPGKRTVQETIQQVLGQITRQKVHVTGASRTDAGVHALGQVANVRLPHAMEPYKLLGALNGLLPDDVSVQSVQEVPASFHAIRNAKKKTYCYLIWNSKIPSPFLKNRAWQVREPLNAVAMKKAVSFLKGRHDFSAFRGAQSETKTSVREIFELGISPLVPPLYKGGVGGGYVRIT